MMSGNFVCQRCGRCCGLAPFSKSDYKAAYKMAKNMGITFIKLDFHGAVFYLPRSLARIFMSVPLEKIVAGQVDVTCPFMGKDKDEKAFCRIYDARPEICRLFGVNAEQSRLLRCPRQDG
jgi:Fe-S-cluster containining protein